MESKVKHFMYVPFTGLGLYGGFRGNRWLKNRIRIFEQFVLPSLRAQTNQDFVVWCSWRFEEKFNPIVQYFKNRMDKSGLKFIHTNAGVCFWDDKYQDITARERLLTSLHGSMGELVNVMASEDFVLMTIQPSDDCYRNDAVAGIRKTFEKMPDIQAFGFTRGYIMNYRTKDVKEYNPSTNPPFFTIKFPREVFIDPLKHANYTGPYKSHEYIGEKLKYATTDERGFIVGTHGENISTIFHHPYAGESVAGEILKDFGLYDVRPLKMNYSIRKRILRALPYKAQRKMRYVFGELIWAKMYNWLRS
jgi:hypothetical protein